ncbi:MAG: rhomboid family intramembrane serine protease [Chloroflexota bacterium]
MTDEATLRLGEGRRLLDGGDLEGALRILGQLTGHPNPDLAGEAWLLIGQALYRTDDEAGAMSAWQRAAAYEGSSAWSGWRAVAEQHVRLGQLEPAIEAYREAQRRAPPAERGAIANRIAWLLKETGHDFAARRQFNRARGAYGTYTPIITWALVAINVIVFLVDGSLSGGWQLGLFGGGGPLVQAGAVYGPLVAQGEWYRLLTSAFLHLGLLHLAFNMYALYLFGPIVEQMYGHLEYLAIYLLCAAGGSVLTILAAPNQPAAGASGAIFGLFGLAFVVGRRHRVLLGREARALLSQVGLLLVVNLVITFSVSGISWTGHVGGMIVGGLIGFLLPPTQVATLGGMWRTPSGEQLERPMAGALRVGVYLGVLVLLAVGSYIAVRFVA